MKKYLSLLLILVMVFVAGIKIVKAENIVQPIVNKEQEIQYQDNIKEKAEKRGDIQKKLTLEEKQQIQLKARMKIVNGLTHRTDNLSNILTRIETRIEKLKVLSVDTANAESLILKAKESIELAKTNIIKVQTTVEKKDTLDIIKTNILAVKDTLKQVHTFMSQAVQDLKMKAGEKKVKTSSDSTAAQ